MAAQMPQTHPARLFQMRERPFQALATESQQGEGSRTADPSTIALYRVPDRRVLLPAPSAAIGLGDVTADAHRFAFHVRLIAAL